MYRAEHHKKLWTKQNGIRPSIITLSSERMFEQY
jgi:hypothetical protein